jgi:hypothetical protein
MKFCLETSLRAALAAGFLLASAGVLSAQDEDETPRQREACTPDVYRLCGQYIPNRKIITDCLKFYIKELTRDCRLVMQGKLR